MLSGFGCEIVYICNPKIPEKMLQDLEILTPAAKENPEVPHVTAEMNLPGRKLYIESYGCQMNFADSEIVTSILQEQGFTTTSDYEQADLIFLNTCSIRENAEQKVRNRLQQLQHVKKKHPDTIIGVLGCMAERLKTRLLEEEKMVDMVVGPDAYRDLPNLIEEAGAPDPRELAAEGNWNWDTFLEVAQAVAFFASAESSYITGVDLDVDGGMGLGSTKL